MDWKSVTSDTCFHVKRLDLGLRDNTSFDFLKTNVGTATTPSPKDAAGAPRPSPSAALATGKENQT